MGDNTIKKIGLITSGGDASGMNSTIRSVVRYAIYKKLEVVGFFEGFKGLIENNYKIMDSNSVGGIMDRGGTMLYTARSEAFKKIEGQIDASKSLEKHKIDALVIIGGDGSFRGGRDLSKLGIKVIGIPATIDNDIPGTDYTIGFDTALNVIIGIVSKIRDTASSHDRIFVIEVMGRSSGELATSAGLACGADYILIPEVEEDLAAMAMAIKNHRKGKRHTLVIVAEGVASANDVASSIKLLVGHEVRVSMLGHIQRGGSPSAFDRILSSQFAMAAVDLLLKGAKDCMVGMQNGKIKRVDFDYCLNADKKANTNLHNLAHILSL